MIIPNFNAEQALAPALKKYRGQAIYGTSSVGLSAQQSWADAYEDEEEDDDDFDDEDR